VTTKNRARAAFVRALVLSGSAVLVTLAAAGGAAAAARATVVDDRLLADVADGRNWAAYGRTHDEGHASPLAQIDRGNVSRLGLAWSLDLPEVHNGATVPLAVDGVVYFTVGQSLVHAVDARSGKLLWRFDPHVAKVAGRKLRYTWGPRGVGFWKGRVYVGTTDGRLIAIDARTGREVWSAQTVDKDNELTITGAPRIFGDRVVIGNAGSEWGPNRGYVTAYDAATGRQLWRFWIVPGDPAKGFEDEAMAMAAKTWSDGWWKIGGGGGQPWNSITYDPKFDRVYIGTGNGAPWNQKVRSPGGGDNLFLCSIVALDAKTGKYVWHYQTNPGESWDYNSAMDITLADLDVGGRVRPVILHAPKNGFFYVIDRETGKVLSAEKIAKVTWAERIDLATGRPVETPIARYTSGEEILWPSTIGAHNWQPMSWSPWTGLVFIPTIALPGYFNDKDVDKAHWKFRRTELNTGLVTGTSDAPVDAGTSALLAWDPVHQKKVWEVPTPGLWNGGTMTTAGRLVFQGQADGAFNAYDAETGKKLWTYPAAMGITGAPITYEVDGRQYVSVVAGWGAAGPAYLGSLAAQHGWVSRRHPHRLLTFVLDGHATLPPTPAPEFAKPVDDPAFVVDAAKAEEGKVTYARRCVACHGLAAVAGGFAPDLRASTVPLEPAAFDAVVRKGALLEKGMPVFDELSDAELEGLRHYFRARARETRDYVPRPKSGSGEAAKAVQGGQ
jgi:quinohemoprotein ethanol dehydrogenase